MIKAVCFDLDGTLLPMDLEPFSRRYFGLLATKIAPYGYDSAEFLSAVKKGFSAMYRNDGQRTNEQAFWEIFSDMLGERIREHLPVLESFYENEFDAVRDVCGFDPHSARTLEACRARGLAVAIATSPVFPEIATRKRLEWAGIDPQTVSFYTTYEDHCYAKPSTGYYEEVARRLGLRPEECLMVGNDVQEDMVAAKVGMKVFLLLNAHLINRTDEDITRYPRGGFAELLAYIDELVESNV